MCVQAAVAGAQEDAQVLAAQLREEQGLRVSLESQLQVCQPSRVMTARTMQCGQCLSDTQTVHTCNYVILSMLSL